MAPFIATLLQSGLSLLANAGLAKGKDWLKEKTGVDVDKAQLSPQELTALKQFELENEVELRKLQHEDNKLEVEIVKLQAGEVANARGREIELARANAPILNQIIVPLLALLVVCASIYMICNGDSEVKIAGNSLATLVLGYYFGTSLSSKNKDGHIEKLTQEKSK